MIGLIGKHYGRLNGFKSMYVNSLDCIKVKGGKSECFRIDRGEPLGFSMYIWMQR